MSDQANLARELPLDGKKVHAGGRTWTIKMVGPIKVAADNTIRTMNLTLEGDPTYQLTIEVPGEKLVVEHHEGDVQWILDRIRDWINHAAPKDAGRYLLSF